MKKRDLKLGLLIGFLIGLLALPTLKNQEAVLGGINFAYFYFLPFILPVLVLIGLYIADWLGKKFSFISQIARFVLVGALNTFIDFGVIGFLLWISSIEAAKAVGVYAFFKFLSFSIAATNSYFWNKSWTFGKKGKAKGKEFASFYLVTGIGALINVGIALLVIKVLSGSGISSSLIDGLIAPFAGVLCGFVWNFLGYKFFIFKK